MELIKIIIGLIIFRMDEIKSKLEIEDSPKDLAYLQGELKGLRLYNDSMIEHLVLFNAWEPIRELKLDKFEWEALHCWTVKLDPLKKMNDGNQ